jgi:hypothetical protein
MVNSVRTVAPNRVSYREEVMRFGLSFAIAIVVSILPAAGQVKYPAKPEKYRVDFRYKLPAGRDARVPEFRELSTALKKLGFVPDERDDAELDQFDPTAERLGGVLPSASAMELLNLSAIKTIVLRDEKSQLSEDAQKLVQIRATISTGLDPAQQQLFHEQVQAQLGRVGFQPLSGFDHQNFSLLRGSIPSGKVAELLRDLRDQPSGWFLSEVPRDQLNPPLRDVLPIRLVELLPDIDFGPVAAPLSAVPEKLQANNYNRDLQAYLSDTANDGKPMRVELVFLSPVPDGAIALRDSLRLLAPTSQLEGVYGSIAVVSVKNLTDLPTLSKFANVVSLRLPRLAADQPNPSTASPPIANSLAASNLSQLHAIGYQGDRTRVVVLATDFAGLKQQIGTKLPADTELIDLTAELSASLEPRPLGGDTLGTECALAVQASAPLAKLILVRLDPIAVHQLITVGKATLGNTTPSIALQNQRERMIAEAERLAIERDIANEEYRKAFNDLSDDEKPTKRREAAIATVKKIQEFEKAFKAKFDRLTLLGSQLAKLRGADVVVNTLVWEDGYAHDSLSDISTFIERNLTALPTRSGVRAMKASKLPVWVQTGSSSLGSAWAGSFLDSDGNGTMEFAPPGTKLTAGTWSPELNFLSLVPPDGRPTDTLTTGGKIRVSIQWREPRGSENDLGNDANFLFSLNLLRQIDPTGTKAASDDLTVVAKTSTKPVMLLRTMNSAVFEQVLEVTLPSDGRYALRVDGRKSPYMIAASRQQFELNPRIFVSANDAATAAKGRVVFQTYRPQMSGVAIPGDARRAVTVGVRGGLMGAGPGMVLHTKPDINVEDGQSPAAATGLVAGAAACLAEAGVESGGVLRMLTPKPGATLFLEPTWLATLSPKASR